MPRDASIFCNLVEDEPHTTELLCNLMRFRAFRSLFLGKLLGEALASRIAFEDIETRQHLEDGGCPDIVIKNAEICVYLEVKTDPWRALTARQRDCGYLRELSKEKDAQERWLVFLVPDDWIYLPDLQKALGGLNNYHPKFAARTRIVFWRNDVLDAIENSGLHQLSPILAEFVGLLSPRFVSIALTKQEAHMLVSKEIGAAVWKLSQLVWTIQQEARRQGYDARFENGSMATYFKSGGQSVLWFGIWPEFWKEKGFPLCFGVADDWDPPAVAAFRNWCKDTTDFKSGKTVWTLASVPEETLNREDAPLQILEQLKQVLHAMPRSKAAKA